MQKSPENVRPAVSVNEHLRSHLNVNPTDLLPKRHQSDYKPTWHTCWQHPDDSQTKESPGYLDKQNG